MKGAMGLVLLFIGVSVMLYMGLSMIASIPEPEVGSDEYEQFEGLSKIVDISYSGFWIVLLIIVVIAIIAVFKVVKL